MYEDIMKCMLWSIKCTWVSKNFKKFVSLNAHKELNHCEIKKKKSVWTCGIGEKEVKLWFEIRPMKGGLSQRDTNSLWHLTNQ